MRGKTLKALRGIQWIEVSNADGTYTFISRSGKPITVSGDITEVIFSTGDSEVCSADTKNPFRIKPFGTLKFLKASRN